MNIFAKSAMAALGAGVLYAAPAAAVEYQMDVDPDFPSVIYVEFDPTTMPEIYLAPGAGQGLPVIRGGAVDGSVSGAPVARPVDSSTTSSRESSGDSEQTVGERAEQRLDELVNSGQEDLENMVIDREIEDRILEQIDR